MKAFRFPLWPRGAREPRNIGCQSGSQTGFNHTHYTLSSASVESLWQVLVNLADVSWHPLIGRTDVPQGLTAKPGLIYRVIPRWWPIPICIFVERVSPQQLLSVRLFPVPGLEERIVCRLESTIWGTQVSYSIILKGWLAPVVGSVMAPCTAKVVGAIAKAAEQATVKVLPAPSSYP